MINRIDDIISKRGGISGFDLKMIAVFTMFIDHFAVAVGERILIDLPAGQFLFVDEHWQFCYYIYLIMRGIGRMAFPIYCFLLVEGFGHTKNVWKYLARLLQFALLSEIPFDLALNGTVLEIWNNNVFLTLAIGLAAMMAIRFLNEHAVITAQNKVKYYFLHLVRCTAMLAIVFFSMGIAEFFLHTDYGASGVAAILMIYLLRNYPEWGFAAAVVLLAFLSSSLEYAALLMLVPIHYYNGTRGRQAKYFFYAFYPVHLLFLAGVASVMGLPLLLG